MKDSTTNIIPDNKDLSSIDELIKKTLNNKDNVVKDEPILKRVIPENKKIEKENKEIKIEENKNIEKENGYLDLKEYLETNKDNKPHLVIKFLKNVLINYYG